jgi:DNA-binding XRE family transcriptional regulator
MNPSMHILSDFQIKYNISFSDIICFHRVMVMRYEVLQFENIRNLRIDGGYTQKEIAALLNVRQNTYSQYEIGVLSYPVEALVKLADFYGVSVDYLLGRTDQKQPYPPTKV